MKTLSLLILLLAVFVIPFVSADVIEPGQRVITITNVIENINDFPDHIFFQVGYLNPSMCPPKVISTDGVVPGGYKFCGFSVFAVNISHFDENFIADIENEFTRLNEQARMSQTPINVENELKAYLASKGAKEVISEIHIQKTVSKSSAEQSYTEYYTVDLGTTVQPKEKPVKDDSLIYLYVILPILALIVIIFFIVKSRKK
jgi:hypothetical protein